MTPRFAAIALCSIVLVSAPAVMAAPNAHANAHAQANGSNGGGSGGGNGNDGGNANGNGNGNGNGGGNGTPHSVVRQYAIANGLKQGQLASSLKSWNSLNANPKAFLNNLNNPNSLLGKEAAYICASSTTQSSLATFTGLGGDVSNPPTAGDAATAQAFLDAQATLGSLDPATVSSDPTSYTQAQVDAANLVLASTLTTQTAQATVDEYNAWTAYQTADQTAASAFAAASVSYKGSTDLTKLRQTVDGIIAQKGFDTTKLCSTSTASAK